MSALASPADFADGESYAASVPLPQRLLNIVLFVTVLLSSVAFIEPSPHDGLMIVLLAACVAARVPFDRKIIPLMLLLIVWLIGGFFSVTRTADELSVVCPQEAVPEGVRCEPGWRCLRVVGPLDFSLVGVLVYVMGRWERALRIPGYKP